METDLWQLGLALGLAVDAGLALALALSGQGLTLDNLPRYATVAVSVAVICWTGLAPLVAAFQGAVSLVVRLDAWKHRNNLPPVADTPQPVADKEPEYDAEQQAWRLALDRFFRAGDAAGGFSAGKLSGVAGSDSWPRLVHFFASEAGGNVLRDAGSNVGHIWGHGWTLDRVMLALGNNRLPRPDMPLPVIELYIAPATQRRASQKSKTAEKRTVEGVARPAD
jgi:hypothetical protein